MAFHHPLKEVTFVINRGGACRRERANAGVPSGRVPVGEKVFCKASGCQDGETISSGAFVRRNENQYFEPWKEHPPLGGSEQEKKGGKSKSRRKRKYLVKEPLLDEGIMN